MTLPLSLPLSFTVPGKPVGKGRPRIGRVGGHARMFTPEKTVNYEGLVGWTAAQAMNGQPLFLGPVSVVLFIEAEVPASWSKAKRARALAGIEWPTTKPDIDNVIKVVFDALNGVVWRDDVQVVNLTTIKAYAEKPSVSVEVRVIGAIA